jgi:hypothetical protein
VTEPSDDPTLPLGARIDRWCAGRAWWWRAVVLVLVAWQPIAALRDSEATHLFRGITFGIHEFGHLFFAFGGEWLTVAGGSLLQLIVPIGAGVAIVATSGDWFALSVCGTWLAASLADLAPYIADARAQAMDLVSFSPDGGGHDWHYLLAHAGLLKQDLAIARITRFAAVVVLIASCYFAVLLFLRMARATPASAAEG